MKRSSFIFLISPLLVYEAGFVYFFIYYTQQRQPGVALTLAITSLAAATAAAKAVLSISIARKYGLYPVESGTAMLFFLVYLYVAFTQFHDPGPTLQGTWLMALPPFGAFLLCLYSAISHRWHATGLN